MLLAFRLQLLAPSGALVFIIKSRQAAAATFPNFSSQSNPAYINPLFTFIMYQCSTYRTEQGNIFARITLTMHAYTIFFKIPQGSSQYFRFGAILSVYIQNLN